MKKYSGHKLKKFPDGHDIRGECVLNPCRPPMKGGHTHNHTYNAAYTESITELDVYAIVSRNDFPVICKNSTWKHCAEIPEVPESKLVTYRELARWLAKGNGEVMWANNVLSNWNYSTDEENKALDESLSVRKWDDTEWHKPTREYIGLED